MGGGACAKVLIPLLCACPPTHVGAACEHVNHCYGVVCENDGICENSLDNYTCVCTAQFTGLNCETKIDRERASSTGFKPNYQAAFYSSVSMKAALLALVTVVCLVSKRCHQCRQSAAGQDDSTRRSSTQLHNSDTTQRQQNSPAHHTDNISVISVNTSRSSDVNIYIEIDGLASRETAEKRNSDYEAPECCRYERPTCCHGQQQPSLHQAMLRQDTQLMGSSRLCTDRLGSESTWKHRYSW